MTGEKNALLAWVAVYDEFLRSGGGDERKFARVFAQFCDYKAETIRQNLNRIKRGNESIVGGARACASMAHLRASLGEGKGAKVSAPSRKVSTVTISTDDATKRLRKQGFTERDIKDIISALFVG